MERKANPGPQRYHKVFIQMKILLITTLLLFSNSSSSNTNLLFSSSGVLLFSEEYKKNRCNICCELLLKREELQNTIKAIEKTIYTGRKQGASNPVYLGKMLTLELIKSRLENNKKEYKALRQCGSRK